MKIAFIKRGSFSYTNGSVERILTEHFPEYEVETIDISEALVRPSRWLVIANLWQVVRLYFLELRRGEKTIRDSFCRTPYFFSRVKRYLAERLGPRASEYAFTFQTQSLFDASVPGIPNFVYTDHTNLANLTYPNPDRSKIFAEAWLRLEGTIYRNAARTFTMSEHVRRSVIEQYEGDPNRVTCVYAGSNAMAAEVTLENDGYANQQILFVGKDWERKGGPELVEAFRIVLRAHPKARLMIVGCSPRLDLPNCEIAGPLPPELVQGHFARATVFCMPSRVEPFGIVYLEALQNRIPVVAPRIGALPDFVEEGVGGLLVEPGHVEELAEALKTLLSDPAKCRQLGEAGHRRVQERYTWEAVGRRMRAEIDRDLLLRVIDGGKGG
jgi:glycosyltransferase involved in cell wall biosynthesis